MRSASPGAVAARCSTPAGWCGRRQLFLGDTLDTDKLEASYDAGVLTLRIPVAEQAKPRRTAVVGDGERKRISA